MTRYVALLRAVNLGATRRVPMPRLREVLTARGYGAVRTHLASGNVLLESPLPEAELAADLSAAIADHFALDVPVVVRTADELAAVLAADPLGHVATDAARYAVTFYAEPLDPERVAALPAAENGEHVVRGRELYAWLPEGFQRSSTAGRSWDRLLGAAGTTRNWNTVRKLVELTR
ncbi:DUF1697 domain-containing protein [Blastococcus sp. MG754426]|uniref:DUF1697 domain-containing protein n=1 Tax=unclassified Blastococcus TaxID=2619396 RepID=UPI001EF15BBE|nr:MULTISPECIES: DUF1697 domain-containing protein [unclassified Blastococcus]MCF6506661.1 DUF1697 domain-containing protein [Blastococcus sp. MG754426]MCF6511473.1 DUF1697 domain-containing protein [Blastococcus sp. MG754427]MCF6734858.1 DUF1697 domain-containing protein [Blastococcus sp. KM273129]